MSWQSVAEHSMGQRSTAQHIMAQRSTAQHSTGDLSPARPAQLSTAHFKKPSMDGHSIALCNRFLNLRHHSPRLVLQSLRKSVINGSAILSIHEATDLFPYHASLSIIHIMYFVKNHKLNIPDDVCSLVQHGPQNLCGHDQAGALRLQTHIPSQQACLHTSNRHSLRRRPTAARIWHNSTQQHACE